MLKSNSKVGSGRFLALQGILVDRLLDLRPAGDRRLLKCLAGSQLADDTGLLKFLLEALQGTLYRLVLFYWYYDHLFVL